MGCARHLALYGARESIEVCSDEAQGRRVQQARDLRRQGLSLREICKQVPAAKSSISLWIRGIALTEEQFLRISDNKVRAREQASRTKRLKRQERLAGYGPQAEAEHETLRNDPHFMFGLALYIGEGSKGTRPEIEFINWNYQVVLKG